MGSSEETNTKGIDASVGGLVWVRRRNGSWWPGRILGPEELPESSLISPRSGTPVKLLGREDASVDWYNLEKSKRVKAFRCGEYDGCIEKAKVSGANSSKKAVKYARREDAILHALELESSRQSKDYPEFCSAMDIPVADQFINESPALLMPNEGIDHTSEELSSSEDNSNSAQDLSQSGVSFEEPNHVGASKEHSVQGRRLRTPNDSEDDGIEGVKRMRGLEDLGMGVVSSLKRKRSQVANVHEFLKRKNRRRQLTKVLESTAMVSVPVMCEQLASPTGSPLPGMAESKASRLESNESKISFSVVINNNSDSTGVSCENGLSLNANEHACDASFVNRKQKENEISSMLGIPEDDSARLFDVPFVGEEMHIAAGFSPIFVSCAPQKSQVVVGAQSSQSSQVETVSVGNEELNESGSTSSGAADINTVAHSIEKSTSKWQLKGKRNSRHTSKNKKHDSREVFDVDDESNAYFTGIDPHDVFLLGCGGKADCNPVGGSLKSESSSFRAKSRMVTETQGDGFQCWNRPISQNTRGPASEMPTPQRLLPFHQSRFIMNPKYPTSEFSLRTYDVDSALYDVNLEVRAGYRPQHVPYISLMSKLNGQPIIGHPLTVEVLKHGFCDLMLSGSDCYSSSCELDVDHGGNASVLQGVDMVYKVKSNSGGGWVPTKNLALQPRVSPSKSPKSKKTGLLSKKIRKLSSLTGSHKQSEEQKKPVVEKIKGPAVACVPLKVVFSRINAALNSSMRHAHCTITPSNL